MNEEQRSTFIKSQIACALIEMEGMKAENKYREMRGYSLAYGEEEFTTLIEKYGIHHNAVVSFLGGD